MGVQMATFTDNMKHLTDEIATCTRDRANDLHELRTKTKQLLSNALVHGATGRGKSGNGNTGSLDTGRRAADSH